MNNQAFKKLEQILEDAINAGTDYITLEYEDEGLEVCYMCRNTGVGNVLVDPILKSGVIALIVDMAKLANKRKGMMVWMHLGKQYNITVEEYDHFGESAFKLILNKPKLKKPKTKTDTHGVPEVFLQAFGSEDEK